jgi:hypothetical protein
MKVSAYKQLYKMEIQKHKHNRISVAGEHKVTLPFLAATQPISHCIKYHGQADHVKK